MSANVEELWGEIMTTSVLRRSIVVWNQRIYLLINFTIILGNFESYGNQKMIQEDYCNEKQLVV